MPSFGARNVHQALAQQMVANVKLYSQFLTRLRIFIGCNFFLYEKREKLLAIQTD